MGSSGLCIHGIFYSHNKQEWTGYKYFGRGVVSSVCDYLRTKERLLFVVCRSTEKIEVC